MTSGFPILRLPSKPLRFLLQTMKMLDVVSISFSSKTAKRRVEELNMNVSCIDMYLSTSTIRLVVEFDGTFPLTFQIPDEMIESEPRKLNKKLNYMKVKKGPIPEETEIFHWKPSGIRFKEIANHVLEIFHKSEFYMLMITYDYDYETLLQELKDFKICKLFISSNFMQNSKLHRSLLVNYSRQFDKLALDYHSLKPKVFHSIVSLNYNSFCLERVALKLEDLLVSNISEMRIDIMRIGTRCPSKQLCLFLKHWINGSNNRLEYLVMNLPANSTENQFLLIALNGIEYQLAPTDKEWVFSDNRPIKTIVVEAGGFDIRRNDGTIATVTVDETFQYLRMFVWK
ncbi:F-box associated domain-containing protein [Caenorhabditis elegans]|uniref:F-box associated domain-containing protein n=1 Tax=Caenorhabditis elegans TaxID=6239 RepID=O76691_CAEEL|nr:F-box associated domain-containing protein [Caenorhabditis elegans]CCD66076.2 F-box associated domain-containing protein [Caenorhabditis elegans]|eukprot:NP_497154.2 F-box B protein [Caenorhabditis elegans]